MTLNFRVGSFLRRCFAAVEYCTPGAPAHSLTFDSQAFELFLKLYSPRAIAVGASQGRFDVDIGHISSIGHKVGALSIFDISEISGLTAAGLVPSPFGSADVIVTRTQESLRGPSGALILYRKTLEVLNVDGQSENPSKHQTRSLESAVKASVFPRHQGGPHNHSISAIAVALAQCQTPAFKEYQELALRNAAALRDQLRQLGYRVNVDGTVYAHVGADLDEIGPNGIARKVLDEVGIVCGVHHAAACLELVLGSYAMTSCSLGVHDFHRIADMVHQALELARDVIESVDTHVRSNVVEGGKATSFPGCAPLMDRSGRHHQLSIRKMRKEVEAWMSGFSQSWD